MITLQTNLKSIFVRIFLIILFTVIIFLVLTKLIAESNGHGVGVLYFMCLMLLFLIVNVLLSLCGIIKVETDEASGRVTLIRFFSRKSILISNINAYHISVNRSRAGTTYGRIIKMKNKKIIELNPGNLCMLPTLTIF